MENELAEFMKKTLEQIVRGGEGYKNIGYVDFDIAIAKTEKQDGGIDVSVLGIGGGGFKGTAKKENVSRVKFSFELPEAGWRDA